jgi:hypothetical protein
MKKTFYAIALFFSITASCLSQKSIEIGVLATPMVSKISFENTNPFSTRDRFPLNFGGQINYNINKFRVTTGLNYLKQGGDLKVLETSILNPAGTGNYFYVPLITKSIVVPMTVNYVIHSNDKTKLLVGVGLAMGYLFSQYQDNSGFEAAPVRTLTLDGATYTNFGAGTPKHFQLEIFDKFYSHISTGIELHHKFKNSWNGFIRPNFNYQIRINNSAQFTFRQSFWSLDLGIMKDLK